MFTNSNNNLCDFKNYRLCYKCRKYGHIAQCCPSNMYIKHIRIQKNKNINLISQQPNYYPKFKELQDSFNKAAKNVYKQINDSYNENTKFLKENFEKLKNFGITVQKMNQFRRDKDLFKYNVRKVDKKFEKYKLINQKLKSEIESIQGLEQQELQAAINKIKTSMHKASEIATLKIHQSIIRAFKPNYKGGDPKLAQIIKKNYDEAIEKKAHDIVLSKLDYKHFDQVLDDPQTKIYESPKFKDMMKYFERIYSEDQCKDFTDYIKRKINNLDIDAYDREDWKCRKGHDVFIALYKTFVGKYSPKDCLPSYEVGKRNDEYIPIYNDNFGKRIEQKYAKLIDEKILQVLHQLVTLPIKVATSSICTGYNIYKTFKNIKQHSKPERKPQYKNGDLLRYEINKYGVFSVTKVDYYDNQKEMYFRGEEQNPLNYKEGSKFNPHFKKGTPEAELELQHVKFLQGYKNNLPLDQQLDMMIDHLKAQDPERQYKLGGEDMLAKIAMNAISNFKDSDFTFGSTIKYNNCLY
jgi:hypothetical protein